MEANENKMGTGKLLPLIISMSLPPAFSMLIQSLYNVVDSMFVARIGQQALAAVSLAFPIQNLILAVAVGFGIGINSYVSRKLGEKNVKEACSAATHGILIAFVHYLVIVVLGLLFAEPFIAMFTQDREIVELGCQYTSIIILFSFGQIVQIGIEKILQAGGNMVAPMVLQIIGAVTNIILDPIFIFGWLGIPAMGVAGAAIATVIGQILALICSALVLKYKRYEVNVSFKGFRWNFSTVKSMYSVGIPSFLIMSIGSFLVTGINFILSAFSDVAVSLFGIYFKLQTFVNMPINGIIQGTMPIMGYNYGARNKVRLLDTLKISLILAIGLGFLGTVLFWIFPQEILAGFGAEEQMVSMGVEALRIISTSYVFSSIGFVLASYLQAVGKGGFSFIITLLRQLILLLPFAFILSWIWSIAGVWIAFPVSEGIAGMIGILLFYSHYKKEPVFHQEN